MTQRPDVVVLGAGMVGVSTALHLLQRGRKVLLLDRRDPGMETSFGNAGIIGNCYLLPFGFPALKNIPRILLDRDIAARVNYASLPRYISWLVDFFFQSRTSVRLANGRKLWPLVEHSLEEHRSLMQGTDASKYLADVGRVALYRTEAMFHTGDVERGLAKELGVPFQVLSAKEFSDLEPHLKPIYHNVVRWIASARVTDPGAVTKAYADRFVREGGTFQHMDVRKIMPLGDGWNIETTTGDFQANEVVICGGPWSADILKPLGYNFPLGIKRGYHQHFSALGHATLSHAIVDVDIGYLLSPMEQGYRLTTGVEIAAVNASHNPVQIARALPHVRELFPLGDALEDKPWVGGRPCFTDSLPLIGPAPNHKKLWLNFGHGHLGFTIGPTSGHLLAEMMCGVKTFCDPTPFRAERFGG